MKRKRLNRDDWWEKDQCSAPEYYQIHVDLDIFQGIVCYIRWHDGLTKYWNLPMAGKTAITGPNLTWLQLIPDGKKHVITAIYLPDDTLSLCYIDIIESIETEQDGVLAFIDKYLDVVFTPEGDVVIDDRDELDAALNTGDISQAQYDDALMECDLIMDEYCCDIEKTSTIFLEILNYVRNDKTDKHI